MSKPITTDATILTKDAIIELWQKPGEITSEIRERLIRTAHLYWEIKGEIDEISKRFHG